MLTCLHDKYLLNLSASSGKESSAKMLSTALLQKKSSGQYQNHLISKLYIKMLPKTGLNGYPIVKSFFGGNVKQITYIMLGYFR